MRECGRSPDFPIYFLFHCQRNSNDNKLSMYERTLLRCAGFITDIRS
jgi:hypothetical protein